MTSDTLDHTQVERTNLEHQVDRLGEFIEEYFPAEAADADMTDKKDVLQLAKDLLKRLWRWEH